jgi:cell division septation protein DedD
MEENPRKNRELGLITTPPTYYTTQRARYLGERYKNNLDRLVERIVRNPKTANLQFANNIASVGGIGFFTHSAAAIDERFLEVIMGVPDSFDANLDHSAKVSQIFSLYGTELLSILVSDPDIYQEKEVNGYGLNLSWRNIFSDAAGPRISLERAVLYFSKAKARGFLRGDLTQSALLGEAVMYAVVGDGPMKLVSYRPQPLKPDWRAPIQEEEILGAGRFPGQPGAQSGKPISLPLATKPSIVEQEQAKSSDEALLLSNEKLAETAVERGLSVKPEHGNEVAPSANKPKEVPIVSSTLMQPSEPRRLPVVQTEEALMKQQDFIDRAAPIASSEQKPTASQQVALKSEPALSATSPIPALTSVPTEMKTMSDQSQTQEPLASKSTTPATKEELMTRFAPQVLRGFVIQLAFGDIRDARRWAETLEGRGFAVSLTEAGSSGSVRVRIGNFAGREEAERQLQAFRQDGLRGILVNLPQAYHPQVQPAPTEAESSDKTVSAAQ